MDDSGLKDEYDIIVVGTGLTECILSGIFSVERKAVLNIDRNWYYGGESASLDLDHFWKTFRWTPEQRAKAAEYQEACRKIDSEEEARARNHKKTHGSMEGFEAKDRWAMYPPPPGPRVPAAWIKPGATMNELPRECNKWHIPLVPKFLMADGELTKFIRSIPALHDIEFLQVGGSYVVKGNAPHKVPSTRSEALMSSLVSGMQKIYLQNFLQFIANYKDDDPSTHRKGLSLDHNTMRDFYKSFGLDTGTSEFIGHAMALYVDDSYLDKPAREPIQRIILYVRSMTRFGKSPYIYPKYGPNELPERFSRVSAVYGGLHALNTPLKEVIYNDSGVMTGVKILHPETKEEVTIKTKTLIADPTYFLNDSSKIKKVGQVVRAICIINHQIEGLEGVDSAQIIIPASQMGRKNDVYIFMVSSTNFKVCYDGYSIVSVSTVVEGVENPERELEPGLARIGLGSGYLGRNEEKFIQVVDLYEPVTDGTKDRVFISRSYDATTHFETCTDDVKDIFKRITGTELIVENLKVQHPEQEDDA